MQDITTPAWRSALRDLLLIGVASIVVFFGVQYLAPQGSTPSQRGAEQSGVPYSFITAQDGVPATWPCRATLTIGVNLSAVPARERGGVERDLRAAVGAIDSVSSMRFEIVDVRDVLPSRSWGAAAHERNGVEILFAVGDAGASDLTMPNTAASGGVFEHDGIVHAGYVYVDAAHIGEYTPGTGPGSRVALFTHELLHAQNLDHVDDPTSVMVSRISAGSGRIGFGDIAGINALESHACR